MTIREQMEQRELEYLSPYAAMSVNSKAVTERRFHAISVQYIKETGIGSYIVRRFGD